MLITYGPENVLALQQPSRSSKGVAASGNKKTPSAPAVAYKPVMLVAARFALCTAGWGAALLLMSDVRLRQFPTNQCLLPYAGGIQGSEPPHIARNYNSVNAYGCWLRQVFGYALQGEDLTPNLGLFWYFLTEMFASSRQFFTFVLHSLVVVYALPLAIRFPKRPVLLLLLQLLINGTFKAYPTVADWALVPCFLMLFQEHLKQLKFKMVYINVFVALLIVAPAMWHQWIMMDAANSNFLFWIVLAYGALQIVLISQMLLITARA